MQTEFFPKLSLFVQLWKKLKCCIFAYVVYIQHNITLLSKRNIISFVLFVLRDLYSRRLEYKDLHFFSSLPKQQSVKTTYKNSATSRKSKCKKKMHIFVSMN